ncbi:DUF4236 domain-containing protein [Chiayiivirga flava]|uniref:DUF4236 domain-containing protein n=1 Tax=Chiayiivirga flava TaxID=659595 RepID=UPI001620AC1D
MGLSFRKSVKLGGGLRLNFSSSGVSLSAGIPGLRFGVGPRGFRVSASAGGFRYSATAPFERRGTSSRSGSIESQASQLPSAATGAPVAMTDIRTENMHALVDSSSAEFVEEIRRRNARPRLWIWVPWLGLVAMCAVVHFALPPWALGVCHWLPLAL